MHKTVDIHMERDILGANRKIAEENRSKLKEGGDSGYNALLSGRRSSSGVYSLLYQFEYVWTSTEYGDNAWRRCISKEANDIGRWNTFPKSYAFSVRCVKNY